MKDINWPKYDWEKHGAPLHCEVRLDNARNYYVTNKYCILDVHGDKLLMYPSKKRYEGVVSPWIAKGLMKLVPFDDTPFEGNV